MTDNNTIQNDVLYTESPASWNTRYLTYLTPNGFECQLLRTDNGQELLERANGAMTFLLKNDCTPFSFKGRASKSNNNGGKTTSAESDQVCPIHDVPMRRFENDGRIWYAHKTEDDSLCNGKAM